MRFKKMISAGGIAGLLIPVSVLLMEAFWIYPWLVWLGHWESLGWDRAPLGFFSVLALVTVSFVSVRLLVGTNETLKSMRWTLVSIGLLVVFVTIRLEYGNGIGLFDVSWFGHMGRILLDSFSDPDAVLMALPAGAYLWARGMMLGRARTYHYVYNNLLFGAASFVLLVIFWWGSMGMGTFGDMALSIGPHVAGFFFCGLVAMALGNLHSVEQRLEADEPQRLVYRRWLPVALGLVAALLLIGVIIATFSSFDFMTGIKHVFEAIGGGFSKISPIIEKIIGYLLIPFEWIAWALVTAMMWIINLFRGSRQPVQPQEGMAPGELPEIVKGQPPPEGILIALKWVLFIAAVILVTVLLAKAVQGRTIRRRAQDKADYEEIHDSLWSWGDFFKGLWNFLVMLWHRLLGRKKRLTVAPPGLAGAIHPEDFPSNLHIREIFRRLLREAAHHGLSWHTHETPFEYAGRFSRELPDAGRLMDEITNLYVDARYGERQARQDQVSHANSLWRQLHQLLRRRIEP